jgi:hypothetical protein
MQVAQALQTGLGTIIDYGQLRLIPGIANSKGENARLLLVLADNLSNFEHREGELKSLSFTPYFQISREHSWYWNEDVSIQ